MPATTTAGKNVVMRRVGTRSTAMIVIVTLCWSSHYAFQVPLPLLLHLCCQILRLFVVYFWLRETDALRRRRRLLLLLLLLPLLLLLLLVLVLLLLSEGNIRSCRYCYRPFPCPAYPCCLTWNCTVLLAYGVFSDLSTFFPCLPCLPCLLIPLA